MPAMLIILGLVNPYPHASALSAAVPNSAGQRLWKMSGLSRRDYMAIRRVNLLAYPDEPPFAAVWAFLRKLKEGDVVLVLGDEARRLLALPKVLVHPQVSARGVTYRQIPHPSGRCLFYNDPTNRQIVEVLFRCLTEGRRTGTSARGPRSRSLSRT